VGEYVVLTQDVFELSMKLMDEETETGDYSGYPDEYKNKAWSILTMLQAELLLPTITPSILTNNSESFLLDDRTCLTVLPYGLAAHLLMTEDQNRASFFNARFDELKRKLPTEIQSVTDVYNVLNGMI
jgi:hypothetical protein